MWHVICYLFDGRKDRTKMLQAWELEIRMNNETPAREVIDMTPEGPSPHHCDSTRKTGECRNERLEARPPSASAIGVRSPVSPRPVSLLSAAQVAQARDEFALIESVLGASLESSAPAEEGFSLPLGIVLDLLPTDYVTARAPTNEVGKIVRITLPDIFEQLLRGKISIALRELVLDVPPGFVTPAVFEDLSTHVDLPLVKVVAAIDPALLKKRTARESYSATVDALPDPFERRARHPSPSAPPSIVPVVPPPATRPAPPPVAPFAQPSAEKEFPTPARASAAPAARRDEFMEPQEVERLGGVNLNAASVEQLMTLSGVSPALAARIVEYRAQHGPFKSVFELKDVERVGRKTFLKITGMPYSETRHHRSERLARLLGLAQKDLYHLPRIAEKLAAQPGFAGCVISDKDGMRLAQFGAEAYADAFSAVAPRMLGQLADNMSEIELGTVRSVSIATGNLMFTVMQSGGIYISAVHERRKLTKSQFEFAEKVAREVDWLLSHRGYAGRPPLGEAAVDHAQRYRRTA